MAQPKLEYISLAVARKIGDEKLNMTAETDGETYTATQRINAINSARQNIYSAVMSATQSIEIFAQFYPEFVKVSGLIDVDSNVGLVPEYSKVVIAVKFKTGRESDEPTTIYYEAKPLIPSKYFEAKHDGFSPYSVDNNNLRYFEADNSIEILGMTVTTGSMRAVYIEDIIPVQLGDADDIPDPYSWQQKIIDEATRILLTDEQIQLKV